LPATAYKHLPMRFLLFICACLLPVAASFAAESAASSAREPGSELADLTIRYVNNEVVTMGDVQVRNQARRNDAERKGLVLPATRQQWIAFSKRSLEDVTDDLLLEQKAKSMGIQADHQEIVLEVLQNAKRSGQGLSLRAQAEERRSLERQRTIERIIGWYESMSPQSRPLDLLAIYQANASGFNRPAQAHLLQIIMRPATAEEREALRVAKAALLRKAQTATAPAIKAIVDARLTAFLNADSAGQAGELTGLVNDLAGLDPEAVAAPASADPVADRALLAAAGVLLARDAALLDAAQVRARLEVVRMSLLGLRGEGQSKTFREIAKEVSQGAAAGRGGDIGWIDPGLFTPQFDAVAFALEPGEVSTPFMVGTTWCLVLCAERKAAQVRTFDEVSGEIERTQRWQRRQQARAKAVAILRTQASVRDINGLDKLSEP
jgi:parvulin-like peptidyl-prolyl isomerase